MEAGAGRGIVAAIHKGVAHLRPVRGSLKTGHVVISTTRHDLQDALRLATDFWSQYWINPKQVDCSLSEVCEVVSAFPQVQPIDNTTYHILNLPIL